MFDNETNNLLADSQNAAMTAGHGLWSIDHIWLKMLPHTMFPPETLDRIHERLSHIPLNRHGVAQLYVSPEVHAVLEEAQEGKVIAGMADLLEALLQYGNP